MKRLSILFALITLVLCSCTPSEKINGVYTGELSHGINPQVNSDVQITESGKNYIDIAVSSPYGNFVGHSINLNESGGVVNLSVNNSMPIYPNQITVIIGYCDPANKTIHFSYTIDTDGSGSGPTIDGSFSGFKNN